MNISFFFVEFFLKIFKRFVRENIFEIFPPTFFTKKNLNQTTRKSMVIFFLILGAAYFLFFLATKIWKIWTPEYHYLY